MRRAAAAAALCALALVPAALAATPTAPVYDFNGRLIETPFAPAARLTREQAIARFLADPKVRDWLSRYPTAGRRSEATFQPARGSWEVKIWWDPAGEIATGRVDDV